MTLKNYIEGNKSGNILDALEEMYPETISQRHAYEEVISYIKNTPVSKFDEFVINVGLIDPSEGSETFEEGIDEDAYLSISGYSSKEDLNFALGFCKWEEWANAEIILEEDLLLAEEELIAICIYEMTFYGFDQESIMKELEDLEKGITNELYH